MRLVFFGSGAFACPALAALVANDHEIAGVFTRPDKPSGRGLGIASTPIKNLAREYRLPIYQPDDPNAQGTVDLIRALAPDIGIVVAYGHLLSSVLFSLPRHGIVNIHASILPAFRGAAPVPHAVLAGEDRTGVTLFRINERFDEGEILGMRDLAIAPKATAESILRELAPVGAQLMIETLGQIEAGWAKPIPQSDNKASKAPKFRKSDGHIDWRLSPHLIDRLVRATQPWPLAYMMLPTVRRQQAKAEKPLPLDLPPEIAERARAARRERERRARTAAAAPETVWVRTNVLEVEPLPDVDGDLGPPPPPAPWEERAYRRALQSHLGEPPPAPTPSPRVLGSMETAQRRWPTPTSAFLAGEAPAGMILRADPEAGIVVRCGGGSVRLVRIQPENRSAMSCAEFLRGTRVKVGGWIK